MWKYSDLPKHLQLHYAPSYCYGYPVQLLRLGAVKPSSNPYFAPQEHKVENQIVRYMGNKPKTEYGTVLVVGNDGYVWNICPANFTEYEWIDEIEWPKWDA